MKTLFQTTAEMLPFKNPYIGFDHSRHKLDLRGGTKHPIFEAVIDQFQPRMIIEVGTWKGTSAIFIASLLKKKKIDGVVLCIDTWLGTVNNLLKSDDPIWGLGKYFSHGYPTLHQQFLANVLYSNLQDYILPLPTTSAIGARWLTAKGIQADMIYIDGSHEEEEVYQDIVNYWKILKLNGVMIGDDWHAGGTGVIRAVKAFSKEKGIAYQVSGSSWRMYKETDSSILHQTTAGHDIKHDQTRIKLMFLNNWGDSPESMMERYRLQTPGSDGIWGPIKGTTDPSEADFFIIMDGLPTNIQKDSIPQEKRIYFQREPEEIKRHYDSFCDTAIFNGTYEQHYHLATWQIIKPFLELQDLPLPSKSKKLSAIVSGKAMTPAQKQRFALLFRLKDIFPSIDIFGRGLDPKIWGKPYKGALNYNQFCKFNGLIDYEYSYAIENSSHENYFTEKLIDCFLTWTKPIYWGCDNIDRFFPSGSYTWIDIYDPNAAEQIAEEITKPVDYEAIREARDLVLHKYNLWPSIQRVLKQLNCLPDERGQTEKEYGVMQKEKSAKNDSIAVSEERITATQIAPLTTEKYNSQYKQDMILDTELFKGKRNGFFVEVGATDGYHFSNTLFFESFRDWKGISIEPNPIEFEKLKKSGRTCIKENYAISTEEGEADFLAIDGYGRGLSGIIAHYDPRHVDRIDREIEGHDSKKHIFKVKTIPLQSLLDRHHIHYVDYCSIDVEGAEMQVLQSIDFDKTFIKCLTIENNYGLEKESEFLRSNGYYLWKRVGCDDYFVRPDIEPYRMGSDISDDKSSRQVDRDFALTLMNPHHAAFLPKNPRIVMETVRPEELLTWMRFDLPAKYLYALYRDQKIDSTWAYDLYQAHEKAFNDIEERDGSGKSGIDDFIHEFHKTLDSIKANGFDAAASAIPVSPENNLLDGSHRVAACLFYRRPVTVLRCDFKGWYYPYDFFKKRGLDEKYCDAIAYEYCKLKPNTYLALLFPSAVGRDEDVRTILQRYGAIYYEKQVSMYNNGPLLLMTQIYRNENWLGNLSNNFSGASLKARECFRTATPMRVFVIETDNPQNLKKAKDEIRDIYKISNHSIHINDTHEETIRVAQLLFNRNGLHFLNHAGMANFPQFQKHYQTLKQSCEGRSYSEMEHFCLTGSAVMALYGIRDARDIDYFHFKESLPEDPSGSLGSHNKEADHYTKKPEDIIFNPENHFYFDGFKFASLEVVRSMKKKRQEPKDIDDVNLIEVFLDERRRKDPQYQRGRVLAQAPAAPLVSILILNYNGYQDVRRCIDSITKNTPEPYEIIVFDNASTDKSLPYLRSLPGVFLVESAVNLGCPAGRAEAMTYIHPSSKYIIFLDNDTIVTKSWTTKFIAYAEKDRSIGMIGPRSNFVSGTQLVQGASYRSIEELESFSEQWAAQNRGKATLTHRLVGFCMFITREVIDKLGSIDAAYGKFGFEDDDYTWRAMIAGFKVIIANDVFIHHKGGPQGKGDTSYNQAMFEAWGKFKAKWAIPEETLYGSPFAISHILSQPFNKGDHYIPLLPKRSETSSRECIKGKVSIIILTFNQLDYTKRCLKSIRRCTPEDHEIIIVDNGSTDGTRKWLHSQMQKNKHWRLIENNQNLGFSRGCNQGIEAARGEFLLLLNNDVIVSEGWLSGLLDCLNHSPETGIVGPMTNTIRGPQQIDDDSYRSVDFLDKFAANIREQYRHRRIPLRTLVGFCMLFKRALVEQIGMLDENFGTGNFEDDDFCLRAVLAGYTNYIAGDTFIHHFGSRSSIGNKIDYSAALSGNRKIIDKKWTLSLASPEGKKLAVLRATELANQFYQKGNMDQAVEALINCIKLTPNAKEIYFELARIFIESKKFSEAWEVVGTMPEGVSDCLKGLECAGYAKEGLGLDDEADAYADRMLSGRPYHPPALNLKGVLAFKKGNKENARNYFQQAIAADPGYGEAHTNLGVLFWGLDNKDEAFQHLHRGFILSPALQDAGSLYYSVVSSLGKFSDAEADFCEASKLYPNHKNLAFLYIDLLIQQGKFDSAMHRIEDALDVFGLDEGTLNAALAVREKIGPLQIEKASKKGTLSLCMIVKNEEKHLVRCLRSVRDVVDEMIVVDTGSTDKTIDIAKVFGAKLFDFPWTGDFSAARNESLKYATGDWILILDADEVISARDFDELRSLMRKRTPSPVAYSIVTRNYTNTVSAMGWTPNSGQYIEEAGAGWVKSFKVRLFPRSTDVFFANPVHEVVEASLIKAKVAIQSSKIIVHHYGKLDLEREAQKGKDYYLLGKIKYESDPTNVKYIYELAKQAHLLHQFEEAVALWQKLLSLIENDHQSPGYKLIARISHGEPIPEIYIQLASSFLMLDRYEEALQAATTALSTKTMLKEYLSVYAHCEIMAGSLKNALSALEDLLKQTPDYTPAMCLMAVVFSLEEKMENAQELFRALQNKRVQIATILNKFANKFHAFGKKDKALLILRAIIEGGWGDQETTSLYDTLMAN